MPVYVDDMRAPYGRMVMSHMVATTTKELLAMARRIGVARRWLQDEGQRTEHFDVCQSKKKLAIEAGAIQVTQMDLATLMIPCPECRGPVILSPDHRARCDTYFHCQPCGQWYSRKVLFASLPRG